MEYVIGGLVVCGLAGAIIGGSKQSLGTGFALGLVLGPLGVLAAFAIDGRIKCPHCGGRLNGEPAVCQHCNAKIRDLFLTSRSVGSHGFGVRCSKCLAPLDLPISTSGEQVKCHTCGKHTIAQTYKT